MVTDKVGDRVNVRRLVGRVVRQRHRACAVAGLERRRLVVRLELPGGLTEGDPQPSAAKAADARYRGSPPSVSDQDVVLFG